MSAFDRLHPALRHQVVNTLGWTSLRPVQEMTIEAVDAGSNLLILAPTAGGKTEAAFFPMISHALTERWDGLAVLYISPIKALLNNQQGRLERLYGLVGLRAAVWHGDVPPGGKRRLIAEPPDCLLTTPESIEGMLVSTSIRHDRLFAGLRAVVVDEVHAFARDDRGWHLLSLLQRLGRLAGRDLQRIGLSATVGNECELLEWLSAGSDRPRRIVRPPASAEPEPEVVLDYVGSLENAAKVIAAMHRGEKRLVFCDSRTRVERLASDLRARGVSTFVSHSSLGLDERRRAEGAFAEGRDCLIVATSALELGIDVGDLDRVIQVDAPPTVSSFLQRMGRTGRRPGSRRNALLLATSDEDLLHTAGLVELWRSGYVEPAIPPAEPMHILAQQLMALALQERGIGRRDWPDWIGAVPAFRAMGPAITEQVIAGMLDRGILWDDSGLLWLGREGQDAYGRRSFLDLVSVFASPPMFLVLHGRHELGSVDESTFLVRRENGPPVLLLAGRAWRVTYLDWDRRRAFVEPAEDEGRSRWRGRGQFAGTKVCAAIRRLLAEDGLSPCWSRRAVARMEAIRSDSPWLAGDEATVLHALADEVVWWTFAGGRANAAIAHELGSRLDAKMVSDNFVVRFPPGRSLDEVEREVRQLADADAGSLRAPVRESARDELKFADCLPAELADRVIRERLADPAAVADCLGGTMRVLAADPVKNVGTIPMRCTSPD